MMMATLIKQNHLTTGAQLNTEIQAYLVISLQRGSSHSEEAATLIAGADSGSYMSFCDEAHTVQLTLSK